MLLSPARVTLSQEICHDRCLSVGNIDAGKSRRSRRLWGWEDNEGRGRENGGLKGFVVGLAVSSVMSEKTLVPVLELMWMSVHFTVVIVTTAVCHFTLNGEIS